MRSRIYKKTQNFSKLLDPGKTKDRIAKWIVLMLFTYTWSQAHKTVLLRRMGAYSWECIEDCHIPIRPGVFNPVSCQEQQRHWYWDSYSPDRCWHLHLHHGQDQGHKAWELDYPPKQSSKSTKVTESLNVSSLIMWSYVLRWWLGGWGHTASCLMCDMGQTLSWSRPWASNECRRVMVTVHGGH